MVCDLPSELIRASADVLESSAPLRSCPDCGADYGHCRHTEDEDDIEEDVLSQMEIPQQNAAPEELSGEQEEIIINPQYNTGSAHRGRFSF